MALGANPFRDQLETAESQPIGKPWIYLTGANRNVRKLLACACNTYLHYK